MAIRKLKNVCAYSPHTGFVVAYIRFWCSVRCWKLPRGECRDNCGRGCADWEPSRLWGARCSSFCAGWLDLRLSCRRGKLSHGIVLLHNVFSCGHKPCCVSNSIGTSSSILRTDRTWHRRTFSCFQKWRITLLVNASQMMKTWRMLLAVTWYEEGIHELVPCTTGALMSKATMWKSRQRYVPQLVYSVSVLLLKNILVWWNVLYFLDGPHIIPVCNG